MIKFEAEWQSFLTLDERSNDRVVLHAVPASFASTRHSCIVSCTFRHPCYASEVSWIIRALLPDTLDRTPVLQLEVAHDDRVDIGGHLLATLGRMVLTVYTGMTTIHLV